MRLCSCEYLVGPQARSVQKKFLWCATQFKYPMHILIVTHHRELNLLRTTLALLDHNLRGDYNVHVVWNETVAPPDLHMRNQTLRVYPLDTFIPCKYAHSHPLVYNSSDPHKRGYWRQQVIKLVFPQPTRWCVDSKNRLWRPIDLRQWDGLHPLRTVEPAWLTSAQEYGDVSHTYSSMTPFLISDFVMSIPDAMNLVQEHLLKHGAGFSEFVYYTAVTGRRPKRIAQHPMPFTHRRGPDTLFLYRARQLDQQLELNGPAVANTE